MLIAWNVFPNAAPTISALPPDALNPHVLLLAQNKRTYKLFISHSVLYAKVGSRIVPE
jgi:hypothetical protein